MMLIIRINIRVNYCKTFHFFKSFSNIGFLKKNQLITLQKEHQNDPRNCSWINGSFCNFQFASSQEFRKNNTFYSKKN